MVPSIEIVTQQDPAHKHNYSISTTSSLSTSKFNKWLRNVRNIYHLLDKRLLLFAVLNYVSDLVLFVSLNLYLFKNTNPLISNLINQTSTHMMALNYVNNVPPVTEIANIPQPPDPTSPQTNTTQIIPILLENVNKTLNLTRRSLNPTSNTTSTFKLELKDSYLTLQIFTILIFVFYFILNYSIKIQFKYHELALNKLNDNLNQKNSNYDYDYESSNRTNNENSQYTTPTVPDTPNMADKDDYYNFNKLNFKRKYFIKNLLINLVKKFSIILLNFYYGYQYCQNSFQLSDKVSSSSPAVLFAEFKITELLKYEYLVQIFILVATIARLLILFLTKYYKFKVAIKNEPLKLTEKNVAKSKSLFLRSNSTSRSNFTNFRLFNLNHLSLYFGYVIALFQLFSFDTALKLNLIMLNLLLITILIRFKSYFYSLFTGILISTYFVLMFNFSNDPSLSATLQIKSAANPFIKVQLRYYFNVMVFISFLLLIYSTILFSNIFNYFKFTSLDRWNLKALSKGSAVHRTCIFASFGLHLFYALLYTYEIFTKRPDGMWFVVAMLFVMSALVWLMFHVINMVNAWFLMNKINECYMMINKSTSSNCQLDGNARDDAANTLDNSSKSNKTGSAENGSLFIRFLVFVNKILKQSNSQFKLNNKQAVNRIMAYKGIRYLSSISYRIGFICFLQTLVMAVFSAYLLNKSPVVVATYLTLFILNSLWLNLCKQLSSIISGTCISYALVTPLAALSKNEMTAATFASAKTAASSMDLKTSRQVSTLSYQQEIVKRCTYVLAKVHEFLQHHLIENFGCDYAASGIDRDSIETKLRAFFSKKTLDGPRYNTYILYYSGPTKAENGNWVLQDGTQYTIENIVNLWKEIHCRVKSKSKEGSNKVSVNSATKTSSISHNHNLRSDSDSDNEQVFQDTQVHTNKSRLILIMDAEHSYKMASYINKKVAQKNVFIALQTVKYNSVNSGGANLNMTTVSSTLNSTFKRSQLPLVGKFTLDWIRYNCKGHSGELFEDNELYSNQLIDDYDEINYDALTENEDNLFYANDAPSNTEETANDDSDEVNNNINNVINIEEAEREIINKKKRKRPNLNTYECVCAFSSYWSSFSFEASSNTDVQKEIKEFWITKYPKACQPFLKILNCPLFYVRINCFNGCYMCLVRLKNKFLPLPKEYDTGHGFKLLSS